ncbi:hypothetical protein CoNPh11_CDS0066 [Staphylococcus phage S-CoN_Ph11]|nr:hypothetical protein CoNPh11_CDS0066 [Staphylococcus phage S-CoN_Ph11]
MPTISLPKTYYKTDCFLNQFSILAFLCIHLY